MENDALREAVAEIKRRSDARWSIKKIHKELFNGNSSPTTIYKWIQLSAGRPPQFPVQKDIKRYFIEAAARSLTYSPSINVAPQATGVDQHAAAIPACNDCKTHEELNKLMEKPGHNSDLPSMYSGKYLLSHKINYVKTPVIFGTMEISPCTACGRKAVFAEWPHLKRFRGKFFYPSIRIHILLINEGRMRVMILRPIDDVAIDMISGVLLFEMVRQGTGGMASKILLIHESHPDYNVGRDRLAQSMAKALNNETAIDGLLVGSSSPVE